MIDPSVPITLPSQGSEIAIPANINTTLPDSAIKRIKEATPESTSRAYRGDWKRFEDWCEETGRDSMPATPQTLAAYVDALAEAGKAPGTIYRAMASIAVAHHTGNQEAPDTLLARKTLKSYRREWGKAGKQVRKAEPVTINALRAMVLTLDLDKPLGVRDRALIVLGFALAARRSEIAALDITDLTITEAGVDVRIRSSKTDQDAKGRNTAVPYGTQPETCPVRCVQAWVSILGRNTGPLFVPIDRHGVIGRSPKLSNNPDGRLSAAAVALVVNRSAKLAGLNPAAAWSGHSLRRGFATETYRAGADRLRIARHGGWTDHSRTLTGYIDDVDRWEANPLAKVGL